ncbi:MAG: hypothetical protein QOK26_2930 [Pseudonocardiales bacterium]|nr:hypothetical protein [Pseudonocardiales bacterium]
MRSATLLFTTTVAAIVLIIVGAIALGEPPSAAANGQEVADWFVAHGGQARTYAWLLVPFAPLFATFTALVRARLPLPHRDVFLIGSVAFLAETAVSTWFWAGLSWHAEQLEPATARTLLDVASFWGPVLNSATITMLAPVVVLSWGRRAVLPRWLGAVGAVALAEQTIETVTIFGQTGFIVPGGPMNVYLGAGLVSIWVLCLGITLAKRSPAGQPSTPPATAEPQTMAS